MDSNKHTFTVRPSPGTSSLLFFSSSVGQTVASWVGHADDIISTSAPVLLCNLDTIPLMTPELCPRSGLKVMGQIRRSVLFLSVGLNIKKVHLQLVIGFICK